MTTRDRAADLAALTDMLRSQAKPESLRLLAWVVAFAGHTALSVADLWNCVTALNPEFKALPETIIAHEAARRRPRLTGLKGGRG